MVGENNICSSDYLRWGIIGCGDVTEKKSGSAAYNQDGSTLVAVMRRDSHKAKDYATRHGVPRWYDDAQALVDDSEVDAVYIATPPSSHLELALRVAANRKPCIVEKPMARSLSESEAMASAFAQAGVPLFVAFYRRAYPRMQRLRNLLRAEAIGMVSLVSYRLSKPKPNGAGWRVDVSTSGGGHFVDVGSHVLDLLDWLFGPLREVHGSARGGPPPAPEERVAASFALPGGAVGVATWDFNGPPTLSEDVLEVHGTNGLLRVPDFLNGDTIELLVNGESQHFMDTPPPTVQRPFVATAIDAIRNSDESRCESTASSALRTAAVMDAILSGYYGGRRDDAFWERAHTWHVEEGGDTAQV